MITMLNALRGDAWLHAYGDPMSPEGRVIKAQVRDAFFGDTDDCKGMVAGQSLLATRQALKGRKARPVPHPGSASRISGSENLRKTVRMPE